VLSAGRGFDDVPDRELVTSAVIASIPSWFSTN